MRFRPNGKNAMRRWVVAIVATTALAGMAPGISACAATAASPGSSVSATVNANALKRLVPTVVGWNAANAAIAIHARGFSYSYQPPKGQKLKTASHWTITKQSPKGGSHVRIGSKIVLSVVKSSVYASRGVRSFYAKDYGTFTPIAQGGTGGQTFDLPAGITAALVVWSYSGGGHLTITELGKGDLPTGRVLVKSASSPRRMDALGLSKSKVPTTAIEVNGTGKWRVTIEPIASAPIIATPAAATGDGVYLYSGPAKIWTVSSPGQTTFMLNQISSGSNPNLAVDESGSWAGQVALQPGPSVVEIHSNGAWTIHQN
jgi:hypothetical protein